MALGVGHCLSDDKNTSFSGKGCHVLFKMTKEREESKMETSK
jgi:hypothetical protein